MDTDFGRELLEEVRGKASSPRAQPEPEAGRPGRSFAKQVRHEVETGADLDWVMRHFHLTREELRDICPEAVEDDEAWDAACEGFGNGGY